MPCSYRLLVAVFISSSLRPGILTSYPLAQCPPSDQLAPLFSLEILSSQREPRCPLPCWGKALATPKSKSSWPGLSFNTLNTSFHSSLSEDMADLWEPLHANISIRILSSFSSISGAMGQDRGKSYFSIFPVISQPLSQREVYLP